MKRNLSILAALVAASLLAGCDEPPKAAEGKTEIDYSAKGYVTIPGLGQKRCLNDQAIRVAAYSGNELTGGSRLKFLTQGAANAGVRVKVLGYDDSKFGSQTLYFYAPDGNCLIWAETLTIQDYVSKLGLDPVGISPYYEYDIKSGNKETK